MLKRIVIAIFFACLTLHASSAFGLDDTDPFARKSHYRPNENLPYIKVLVAKNIENPVVEVKGAYRVFNPHDDSLLSQGYIGKRYPLQTLAHGVKWGEEFPDIFQIAIVPGGEESLVYINGTAYRGIIYAYDIDGKISIVNELPIEEFVKSFIATNTKPGYDQEALEALAIVVRTDAYYNRLNAKNPYWDVNAIPIGFKGYVKAENYALIRQAVIATHNLVMLSTQTKDYFGLLPATWTENCAGKTAPAHVIFPKPIPPYRIGVDSPMAAVDREKSRWAYTISKPDLASLVNFDGVTNVHLFTDSFSGKVYAIRIQNQTIAKDIDFFKLQDGFGKENIKSNDFTVKISDDYITFVGYGAGHGVGLCLYSAQKMALDGALSPQIVEKFFPNTKIVLMPSLRPMPDQQANLQKASSRSRAFQRQR